MRNAPRSFAVSWSRSWAVCLLLLALGLAACGETPERPAPRAPSVVEQPLETVFAERRLVPVIETAVGAVRPKTEISVASQVMGRVALVAVRPGQRVEKGQPLVELDADEFVARAEASAQALAGARAGLGQAEQAVAAARAQADKARSTFERLRSLHQQGAVAAEEMERARRDMLQAEASLAQTREGYSQAASAVRQSENLTREARINQGYTRIEAPEAGEVVRRMVEPGDMAVPGRPLLLLQTGGAFWLEAAVREGLMARVPLGARLTVAIDALGMELPGVVEEIVPSADPATRTVIVRVSLPPAPGIYQGMFGRLLIPAGEREAVLAPARALRRVGQLVTARVADNGGWRDITVRPGREIDGLVEIQAGLSGGETLALTDAAHGG